MYNNYNNGMYGANPYSQQFAQNRLAQMEQQYNGMYQPNYQQQNQMQQNQMQQMNNGTQLLKGRPVSSFDEAKASMIDLDGSMFIFTDLANNCIYTKQVLLDGTAELKTYVLQENKQNNKKVVEENREYVLREDFEKTIKELSNSINGLKEELNYDATNVKSDASK